MVRGAVTSLFLELLLAAILKSGAGRHIREPAILPTAVTVGSKGGISADIRFRPNVQSIFPALSVSSPAINIK